MTDEQKAAAVGKLKRDLANVVKLEELVKQQLQNGADPHYVAMRHGVALERCQRYAAAWAAQHKKGLKVGEALGRAEALRRLRPRDQRRYMLVRRSNRRAPRLHRALPGADGLHVPSAN